MRLREFRLSVAGASSGLLGAMGIPVKDGLYLLEQPHMSKPEIRLELRI